MYGQVAWASKKPCTILCVPDAHRQHKKHLSALQNAPQIPVSIQKRPTL